MIGENAEHRSFYPATHWTQIFQARDLDKTSGRNALGQIVTGYRSALIQHLKWKFQASPEQTEDWLQGFLEKKVLECRLMQHADKARGRFRNFLLNALDHFVLDEIERDNAQKRRPAKGFVPLETKMDNMPAAAATGECDPGDVAWARDVLTEAVTRTRSWYEHEGNPRTWQAFFLGRVQPMLEGSQRPSDQEIGRHCELPPEKVSDIMNNAARKLRTELRTIVAEYAGDHAEIEEELRNLVQILRKAG
jgi:RNA polymerase sigma-70 factor (ECF subfamily)